MDLKKLGFRIKYFRKKRKLTQDELSYASGMNSKHLSEVERGTVNISIQNLDRISESLGLPLAVLLDMEPRRSKEELCLDIVKHLENSNYERIKLIHRLLTQIAE
ncbi:MAG: helix-turn-helix transcriptional regulator [Deltaproteobacteria bacterium]|jgi:transcriptional regulator with XRE-family HTH domain|nr:helix-turn-helix transcriptional regulator [Deltaproteobacteria bacterium]